MERDPRAHLVDIVNAASAIREFVSGQDIVAYRSSRLLRSAVERQFEIVGEALNRLRRDDPELAGRIPHSSRIVGFRNVLAHGYDIIDDDAVWTAITVDLPRLIAQASALLVEHEA